MFKNPNRTNTIGKITRSAYIILCVLFIGSFSSVFAIDLSQAFSQAKEQSLGIDSLFKGKSTVTNLYSKALKIVKDKEITSTTISFDQLKIYFSTCAHIEHSDFINILYHSNFSFRNTFDQILPSSAKKPTTTAIDKSYTKFFTCRQIYKPTSTDVQNLTNEINGVYYDIYTSTYTLSTLNKSNFGSDLFWNGSLDDSDFDLLYDINQVGKILFADVSDSPEILFYRLPKVQGSSAQNGSDLSSLSDQSASQVGAGGGSFPDTTGSPSGTVVSSSTGGGISSQTASTNPSLLGAPIITDTEVQNFIADTNGTSSSIPGTVPLVFGNQCLSGDTASPLIEEQTPHMTPEEYMSGISNFITKANVEEVINTMLLTKFTKNNPLPTGGSTSDPGRAEAIVNKYAEQAFGDGVIGSCEYGCKDLPLDKQVACQFDCSKSCVQKCGDSYRTNQSSCASVYATTVQTCQSLSVIKKAACLVSSAAKKVTCNSQANTDQLLCVSDCTCFLIAGPNGKGWEKMEDMFRIKFCKVPVQKQALSPGKTVYSIQGIFQEISDVLEGLRDSGQMVKFSQTKEFLDGNIKIKFADNFAFKLQMGFKPVFAQKTTTIKRQEQSQANVDLNIAVLDMNSSAPEADDYNKYIVVADPISNNAGLEPATSLDEVNENIKKFATAASAARNVQLFPESVNAVVTSYAQNTKILFVQNMIDFLSDNQLFLNNLSEGLLDINKMSLELKTKIENAK